MVMSIKEFSEGRSEEFRNSLQNLLWDLANEVEDPGPCDKVPKEEARAVLSYLEAIGYIADPDEEEEE